MKVRTMTHPHQIISGFTHNRTIHFLHISYLDERAGIERTDKTRNGTPPGNFCLFRAVDPSSLSKVQLWYVTGLFNSQRLVNIQVPGHIARWKPAFVDRKAISAAFERAVFGTESV